LFRRFYRAGQALFAFAIILIHNDVSFYFFIFKNKFNLKNVVAIAICLAAFTNQALAQAFNYTDASGVTATYTLGVGYVYQNVGYNDGAGLIKQT
jgi:hypothetical protein